MLGQPQFPPLDGAGIAFYLLLLIRSILQSVQSKGLFLKGGSVAFEGSLGWVCVLMPQVTSCWSEVTALFGEAANMGSLSARAAQVRS